MSTKAESAKKANIFNDGNEILYSPYPSFMPADEPFGKVPWSEWDDAKINAEVWGETKKTTTGTKISAPTSSVLFEDPDPPELPLLIRDNVHSWKRPHEVFTSSNLTVYDPSNGEFQLSLLSTLAECDFFKYFNQLLSILQYYSLKHGFPVELETPNFVPTTQGELWRPWHHIYALCKAGKGQVHKPFYSSFGKYIIRLYYMGLWRQFLVDDQIPCDVHGNCMLPVTQVSGELWPILLAKALLKVISLTTTTDLFLIDFPLLSLFTGWVHVKITTVNKSQEQIWRRFVILTSRYEFPQEHQETKTAPTSIKDFVSKRGSSKKNPVKSAEKKENLFSEKFCFLLASLEGLPEEKNFLSSHIIAVTMHRDLPLGKAEKREGTKKWKRIRWIYWASGKGLWTDELKMPPYRCLQYITFAKELATFLAPDPKQEAAIFNIPSDDELDLNDQLSTEDNKPEHWSDFFKLYGYLFRLDVFLKPSFFPSKFRVTSLRSEIGKPVMMSAGGKSSARPPPPLNLYFQAATLKPSGNEPPLMLCESKTEIFLCISLWVSPLTAKNYIGYLDSNQPEVLKISHGCLIIERVDWRTIEQGEIIGVVKTVGNCSIYLNLKPGRHILKLWLHSDSPYLVDIYSNIELCIHKGFKIRFLMNNETERIIDYITNVSNAFIALSQKFGKPGLPNVLRDFYEAIKPGNKNMTGYHAKIDEFIEIFLYCILSTLKSLIPTTDEVRTMMGALQSLFVNPNIRLDFPREEPFSSSYGSGGKKIAKKIVSAVRERTLSEILSYPWTVDDIKKITKIQKVFRGYRVRLLWKQQTPGRKEFKPYNERLKKICDAIFAPAKRETEVGKIIRKVVLMRPDLLKTFKFFEDFPNVIQVDEHMGRIPNVEPFAWIPIARFIIACHCDEAVPCSFHFSCNLEQFVIQGVDNDTNEELFRLTNSISPHYYQSNVKGYTIFVFGWNDANAKTVNWRLEMVKMKHFQVIHLCNTLLGPDCHPYVIPSLTVFEVKNFYIPNHKSRISRCLIKIQKRTLLTLRILASYPDAQFVLAIFLDKKFNMPDSEATEANDLLITSVQSTNGAAMLSSIILEYVEANPWWEESNTDEEATLYILETFIINNSWPLTKQEWGVIEPIRVNGENWKDSATSLQSRKGVSDSRKKLTRASKRVTNEQRPVENPFWLLQVLNESAEDPRDQIIVEEDRAYAESVRAMKISWEEKNPGRRKKGRDLRMKFLQMIYEEEKEKHPSAERDFEGTENDMETVEKEEIREDFEYLLEKMSSFSYLVNDKSSERFSKSPRVLPKMPTNNLLCKYKKREDHKTNTEVESSMFEDESEVATNLNRNMADEAEEDRKDFLRQCLHFRQMLWRYLAEEQKLSNQLMEEAYESRLKAVERLAR